MQDKDKDTTDTTDNDTMEMKKKVAAAGIADLGKLNREIRYGMEMNTAWDPKSNTSFFEMFEVLFIAVLMHEQGTPVENSEQVPTAASTTSASSVPVENIEQVLWDAVEANNLSAAKDAYLAQNTVKGGIKAAIASTLTTRRMERIEKNPLTEAEFLRALSRQPRVYREKNTAFQTFMTEVDGPVFVWVANCLQSAIVVYGGFSQAVRCSLGTNPCRYCG